MAHDALPAVSCICLTYARFELLEEAIHSFLQQDYAGRKELIVLNDYAPQTLVFDHPDVRVLNVAERFATVGDKMNAAVALASHDVLFVWDDDDICLPNRLSFSMAHFDVAVGYFKPESVWLLNFGQLSGPGRMHAHMTGCYSRALFEAVGGYPSDNTRYDAMFERRLAEHFPRAAQAFDIRLEDIFYIYRWGGSGWYHLSEWVGEQPTAHSGSAEIATYLQRRFERGELRHGEIELQPRWKADYERMIADHVAGLAASDATQPKRGRPSVEDMLNIAETLLIKKTKQSS